MDKQAGKDVTHSDHGVVVQFPLSSRLLLIAFFHSRIRGSRRRSDECERMAPKDLAYCEGICRLNTTLLFLSPPLRNRHYGTCRHTPRIWPPLPTHLRSSCANESSTSVRLSYLQPRHPESTRISLARTASQKLRRMHFRRWSAWASCWLPLVSH